MHPIPKAVFVSHFHDYLFDFGTHEAWVPC